MDTQSAMDVSLVGTGPSFRLMSSDMELKPQVEVADTLLLVGLDGGAHTSPATWPPLFTSRTSVEDTMVEVPAVWMVDEVNEDVESAAVDVDSAAGGGANTATMTMPGEPLPPGAWTPPPPPPP